MSVIRIASELVGNVGFGVIKNTVRLAFGGGKAVVGLVTEDEELIKDGWHTATRGAVHLGAAVIGNSLANGEPDAEHTLGEYDEY